MNAPLGLCCQDFIGKKFRNTLYVSTSRMVGADGVGADCSLSKESTAFNRHVIREPQTYLNDTHCKASSSSPVA